MGYIPFTAVPGVLGKFADFQLLTLTCTMWAAATFEAFNHMYNLMCSSDKSENVARAC